MAGSTKANRREPKSCFGRVFNFKLGYFVMCTIARPIQARPSLELKTRPRFRPVSLSLSMHWRFDRRFCSDLRLCKRNFTCLRMFALNADVVKGGDHFGPLRKQDGLEPRNLGTDDLGRFYKTFYGRIYEFGICFTRDKHISL